MWGHKASVIRYLQGRVDDLYEEREEANVLADAQREVVKRLSAQVENYRLQNQRLIRANRALREEAVRTAQGWHQAYTDQEFRAEGYRKQNLELIRQKGALRDQRRFQHEAVKSLISTVRRLRERLRDAGLETWSEAVKDAEPGGVVMDLNLDPVTMGGFLSLVEAFGETRVPAGAVAGELIVDEPAAPECTHPSLLYTRENGGEVVVCTTCAVIDTDEEDGA